MRERGREGMGEGGSVESFAKDSVSIHTMLVFLNENTPFHIFLKIHLFIFMNIKYVCTYIYIYSYTYIYRYVHTVGGFGVPIRDFLGDFLVQKFCGKIKYHYEIQEAYTRAAKIMTDDF